MGNGGARRESIRRKKYPWAGRNTGVLFVVVVVVVVVVGWYLTSQQHGRKDIGTGCHTEMEVTHHICCLMQLQYTATGPTSPSTDPIKPGT